MPTKKLRYFLVRHQRNIDNGSEGYYAIFAAPDSSYLFKSNGTWNCRRGAQYVILLCPVNLHRHTDLRLRPYGGPLEIESVPLGKTKKRKG